MAKVVKMYLMKKEERDFVAQNQTEVILPILPEIADHEVKNAKKSSMPKKRTVKHKGTVQTGQRRKGKSYGQDKEGTQWEYRYGMRKGVSVNKKTKSVTNKTGKTDQKIKYARYKKPGMKKWSDWKKVTSR